MAAWAGRSKGTTRGVETIYSGNAGKCRDLEVCVTSEQYILSVHKPNI